MEPIRKLYLDTNIFILLGEGEEDPRRNRVLDIVVSQKEETEKFLATSDLTLAELLVRPYQDGNEDLIKLYDHWIDSQNTWLDVGAVTRDVLWFAAVLRNQYPTVKLPDAIHLSTAVGLECTHVVTADEKLPREISLTHSRWGWSRSAPPLRLVSPTVENLQAILEQRQ